MCSKRPNMLIGIGNPLLDISANVDIELLKQFELEPDGAIMADPKHMPLYKLLVEKYNAEFIAGGSVQNSLRVAEWVLHKPRSCTYFGCVGDDDYAKILKERATADGVNALYQVTKEAPTGTCAVLVTGMHRSLCANLAAAQKFTPDHLAKPECRKVINEARFFYASGFFVAVSPESIMLLAEHAHKNGHTFIMNLSAPFVSQFYKHALEKIIPYIDMLFGNELEALAFAKAFGIESDDLKEIGRQASALPKLNPARERLIVFTQGANPVYLIQGNKVEEVPVKKLAESEIVDTNGAGDSFVGGFLSQLLQGKPYKTCVECGNFTARHIIQHSGCNFSGTCEFQAES